MPFLSLNTLYQRMMIADGRLETLLERTTKIMAGLSELKTAQAAEHSDLVTLTSLITQLLTAFSNGSLSPADAQALLDQMTADDATVRTSISAIQAALPA